MNLHQKSPELLPPAAADCATGVRLIKIHKEEKTRITNRSARSTYPKKKSVLTSEATPQELFDQHVFPGLYAIESQLCPQLNIRTACLDGTPCSMYCSPMTTLGLGLYCFRCPHLRRPRSSSLI